MEQKKKYLVLVVALGLVGMVFMGVKSLGKTKVNMQDYVSVVFNGIDGHGKAVCDFDFSHLEQDLAGDTDGKMSMQEFQELAWITEFEMGLSCEVDKEDKLSNGDVVKVNVSYDEEVAKKHKLKVKGTSFEVVVEGLMEGIEVDAFSSDFFGREDGVALEYSWVAPEASLSIRNKMKEEPYNLIRYTVDKDTGLKNGDEVKITATLRSSAAKKGYVLKEETKTIKVDGLNTYVTNLSQLSEADQKVILDKAKAAFNVEAEDCFYFYDKEDKKIDMSNRGTTFSNFEFANDQYDVNCKDVLIIPYTLDTKGQYSWIGGEFYNQEVSKSFSKVNGYVAIRRLKVDSKGQMILDDVYYEGEKLFETKEQMKTSLNKDYGV